MLPHAVAPSNDETIWGMADTHDADYVRWRELPLMETGPGNIVLFRPHVPKGASAAVARCLETRWLGQGPLVDEFEARFAAEFANRAHAVAVNSGTSALHLAYLLAGVKTGDEVVAPVFTCSATNIPLLYIGATVRFADVEPSTLNIDPAAVRAQMSERTKAIACVHYGGLPCDMDELLSIANEWNVPLIQDSAHALGATYHGEPLGNLSPFSISSFQAIKHVTTGDGGMLTVQDPELALTAKRLRWFGIDRAAKQGGIWGNDITEVGYKYQMTDIAAALGLAGLDEFDQTLALRRSLYQRYVDDLRDVDDVTMIGIEASDRQHAAWLVTILVNDRQSLIEKLAAAGIESGLAHYRNDMYSVFAASRSNFPIMDAVEGRYLCLPLHTHMTAEDVSRVCSVIKSGW